MVGGGGGGYNLPLAEGGKISWRDLKGPTPTSKNGD